MLKVKAKDIRTTGRNQPRKIIRGPGKGLHGGGWWKKFSSTMELYTCPASRTSRHSIK